MVALAVSGITYTGKPTEVKADGAVWQFDGDGGSATSFTGSATGFSMSVDSIGESASYVGAKRGGITVATDKTYVVSFTLTATKPKAFTLTLPGDGAIVAKY